MGKYSYLSAGLGSGDVFTYLGETYECEKCESRKRCHGDLIKDLVYRIIAKTGGDSLYRVLRDSEIVPYEIAIEPVILLVPPGRMKEGAVMELSVKESLCKAECSKIIECPILYNMLVANRKIRVLEKLGSFECPNKNLILIRAEVLD